MIDGRKLPYDTPIYTYVSPTGESVDLHVNRIKDLCKKGKAEIVYIPVNRELAKTFIVQNSVSFKHAVELGERLIKSGMFSFDKMPPVYVCERQTKTNGWPDIYIVDGHHRYCLAASKGWPLIRAYFIKYKAWQKFRIYNLPKISQEQLAAICPDKIRQVIGEEG